MARASKRSFVSRVISKVTEIKKILAEVAALTIEKTNLELNPTTNAQAITEKTQKILTRTRKIDLKVKKSEDKVNAIVVKKIEQKVAAALTSESDEDHEPVISLYNKQISFNNSIYYNLDGNIDSMSYFFGPNVVNSYFNNRFIIFKGQNAIDYLRISSQLENTTDSRGYYKTYTSNGITIGGEYRKNYLKYKRNDIWILYDNLNDIVYYNNYTGNNFPTKKWYRPDILYKTSIELKVKTITSSGSGSGGGGSGGSSDGTGNFIGTDLVDQFLGGSGSDGSSGGNSIGTDLVDQFLGGSDGSSGGQSIGTSLIDQFLIGPLFGPNTMQGLSFDSERAQGPYSLYINAGCGSCEMISIDTQNERFVYRLFGNNYSKDIDYNIKNIPSTGWTNINDNTDTTNLSVNPSDENEWTVIFGTANGWYNNAYWKNNVKTTLDQNGNGFWNNKFYKDGNEVTLNTTESNLSNTYSIIFESSHNSYYIRTMGGLAQGNIVIPSTFDDGVNGLASIRRIAGAAFYECTNLTSITIPSSIGDNIGSFAFAYCINLIKIICSFNPISPSLFGLQNFSGLINNKFYQNNTLATGLFQGKRYENGELFTGNIGGGGYWVNGVLTTLNENGNGSWNGGYYLGGQLTTLNTNGTGTHIVIRNIDGQNISFNLYFINGQETTLDQNGTGTWNGQSYTNGILDS